MARLRPGRSLRWRLTLLSSAVFAIALVVGSVVLTWVVSASRVSALDDIASGRAVAVARLVETGQLPTAIGVAEPGEIVQVLAADGSVVATSANASRTLPVLSMTEIGVRLPRDAGRDTPTSWTTSASPYAAEVRIAALSVAGQDGTPVTVVVAVPLGEVQGVVRALRVALWAVVPILTLLVAGVVWVTVGRALRPVEELRSAAESIAASGSGRLPGPTHDDEIGALAQTLDDMLDRLQVAADRQRSFVADAAHELRSPIAALRASTDVAAAYPGSYSVAEFAAQVCDQVTRLQGLVDDLLVLARIGSQPLKAEDVDLLAVVREVVAGEAGVERPVEVVIEGSGQGRGDARGVTRIVRNLVDNARRHARTQVRVQVSDSAVTVIDDGPGIDPADRERVFERFTRLDAARDRGDGGSGLGLAIARETAEYLGGSVVLDEAEGGGLVARVKFPQ